MNVDRTKPAVGGENFAVENDRSGHELLVEVDIQAQVSAILVK